MLRNELSISPRLLLINYRLHWCTWVTFLPSVCSHSTPQQLVPAHLATSPIPTESHLFWISEVEQRTANAEDDVADPDDPPEPPSTLATTTKKKKRRRKKHKGDPRREELTPPISVPAANAGQNDDIFEMDLSSDEEPAAHVSRWVCKWTAAETPEIAQTSFVFCN